MRKIIGSLVVSLLAAYGSFVYADSQATSLGLVRVQISSAPIALINTTVPFGAFELIGCTDCIQSSLCISSGTGTGAYVVSSSSHSIGSLATMVHCR